MKYQTVAEGGRPLFPPFSIRRFLILMKLTVLLTVVMVVQATAEGTAQSITLAAQNESLSHVMMRIQKQSGYLFFFKGKDLADTRVDFSVKSASLAETMNTLLHNLPMSWTLSDGAIIIRSAPVTDPVPTDEELHVAPESKRQHSIGGQVLNEQGDPIEGVTVSVKGKTTGTTTDGNGQFQLTDIEVPAALVFSSIGYESLEVEVANTNTPIHAVMKSSISGLDEVVVVGYGTRKKKDLTGSIANVDETAFKYQSATQFNEMLAGTVAGFNGSQATSAEGGASMEVRGRTSLSANTTPLVVVDGAIFNGNISDINSFDIESVDILKDASSAAVFGAKAASGVIIITTKQGVLSKPTVVFSGKVGMTESNNQRRGLGPDAYIQFRQDFLRQVNPGVDFDFYTRPDALPNGLSLEDWRALSANPLTDDTQEWMSRLGFYDIEKDNFVAGRTMDMYDAVFQRGLRQEYDLGIRGGTEGVKYYWSIGYDNNEGIRVGDRYAAIRSRLNADFKVTDWLKVGMNVQFANQDNGGVPAGLGFYVNSPFGQLFDADGNLERYPHGHSSTPLLDHYRKSVFDKENNLFANLFAEVQLPFGIKYRLSYQPRYANARYMEFTTISKRLGGLDTEDPTGERTESSTMSWLLDNILTWNKTFNKHEFDVTLLASAEKNSYWSTEMSNRVFSPNQELGYHGLQFGASPTILNDDTYSTGDALMARLNYSYDGRYLLTASVRRDGYSAFGLANPRATFPAFAAGWVLSEEKFFQVPLINRLKIRGSWGANGNRDIGIYAALAQTGSNLWNDGGTTRVGVFTESLQNSGLRWEKTTSLNFGLDVSAYNERVNLTFDIYRMNTIDLLMNRTLPRVTGFSSITSNLGEVENRGIEVTVATKNIDRPNFAWQSNFVFSLNRNKIKHLFGDMGDYTLLGNTAYGELPDFTNKWFPGQAIDVVWDYRLTGIWQVEEAEEAAKYNMEPGDFKAQDTNADYQYVDLEDKQFIGYTQPRYRLGLRNDFQFLKNFSFSFFLRADLGHIRSYDAALNRGFESNDRWNRNVGPVPYWTPVNRNNEYARLDVNTGAYGGGLMVYKPTAFLRLQDVTFSYAVPERLYSRLRMNNLEVFGAIRNLATWTNWPGWDPESGMTPMPRTFTLGINCSL